MLTRVRVAVMGVATVAATGIVACGNGAPQTSSSSGGGGGCGIGSAKVSGLGTPGVKVAATDQLRFSPSADTAKVGQVVQWTNTGTVLHNITFDGGAGCLTDSGISPGATWQVKFTKGGSYTYHCTIHPGMDGTLTVS